MKKTSTKVNTLWMAMEDYAEIIKASRDDLAESYRMLKEKDNQFWRRAFVRSLFASIEGINHRLKVLALSLASMKSIKLSSAEMALLREESFALTDKGDALISKSKLRTSENLLFTLNITAKICCESSCIVDKGNTIWCSFKEASKIRDRLTHPKRADDLIITNIELLAVQKTFAWYVDKCLKDVTEFIGIAVNDLIKERQSKKSRKKDSKERENSGTVMN